MLLVLRSLAYSWLIKGEMKKTYVKYNKIYKDMEEIFTPHSMRELNVV